MRPNPTPTTQLQKDSPLFRRWLLKVVAPIASAVVLAYGLLIAVTWWFANTEHLDTALWGASLVMLIALGFAIKSSWEIAVQVVRPLADITRAVEQLGQGAAVELQAGHEDRAIDRLQRGINQASEQLTATRNRMQSELGRTTIELADKNAKLEAANLARSRLLAAASHDLRQPLYALTLFSSTLRAGETDPDKVARILHIEECVASLDQLFSELLDLSRLESGSMHATPARVVLDHVFEEVSRNFRMLAEARGLRLILRKTDVCVHCDRTMLARILNNLVSNALRYTDEGGVLIGARYQKDGRVRIDVWDTGCGIAPEHQQRVFEEFFQVKPPQQRAGEHKRGLGLGLATVHKLAALTGSSISLASRVGRGTRISVTLPRCQNTAAEASENNDTPLDISGLRVLAIDDEPVIREGLRTLLKEWGCDVQTASDQAQALERLPRWASPPDLVLSDLQLENNVRGPDVLRAIAQHYGEPPEAPSFARLLVTGETRQDQINELAHLHIPILFKPVAPQRLREAMLAAVLNSRAKQGG